MAYLALIRHGASEWNDLGLWTGWKDVPLSSTGHDQAHAAGKMMNDIAFDLGFTSGLLRAQQTLTDVLDVHGQKDLHITQAIELNERNYGDMTGKNKWEIKKEVGEEQFLKWRRGWDEPLPNGESLKDVYERVIPYYQNIILPELRKGKNIIIAAHGNSIRSLIKYLEKISDEDIRSLEVGLGEIRIYQINSEGDIISKETRRAEGLPIPGTV